MTILLIKTRFQAHGIDAPSVPLSISKKRSVMKCLWTGFSLCALLAASAPVLSGQATIVIDDLRVDPRGDSSLTFTTSVATPGIRKDAGQRIKMRPYASDDKLYLVYVAFDMTSAAEPPSDINYYLYSQPVSATDKDVFTEYVVVGTPRGDFSDQWSWVKFHLNDNGIHNGSLELPIHSYSNAALISLEPDASAGTVYLSHPDHKVAFIAKNSLKGFDLYVDGADLTTNNDYYWKWSGSDHHFAIAFDGPSSTPPFPLKATPLNGVATVEPALWKSLSASAGSLKSDQSQDVLSLTVRYNASLGGNPRALTVPIKIRFRPPWWSLFGFAIIGALLGSVLTLLFPATWKATSPTKTIVSAILLAIVAEFLGILMFLSDDSKLVIAGFNLIPTEILPAMGLGILVGLLGLKVLDAFKIPLPTR
jgi:hypothetical protein